MALWVLAIPVVLGVIIILVGNAYWGDGKEELNKVTDDTLAKVNATLQEASSILAIIAPNISVSIVRDAVADVRQSIQDGRDTIVIVEIVRIVLISLASLFALALSSIAIAAGI